ncbi:hypothetical protein D3C75_988550 [compost metagenome]
MAVGDDQVLTAGLDKFGGLAQQTTKVGAIKIGHYQPNAVGAFIGQRLGEKVWPVAQLIHCLEHRITRALLHLAGAI